ncbi:unnamed protein product, partial [Soboliphyme baturini]|uniref:TPR_REGION domain-containing protein n=1 Tax=Soboliphyme baturini TaxID=241478 RepID=A0A183IZV0_9BILA
MVPKDNEKLLTIEEEQKAEAERLKTEANIFFKKESYNKAIELYTAAINLNPNEPSYYGNRSFAFLKTELYGA